MLARVGGLISDWRDDPLSLPWTLVTVTTLDLGIRTCSSKGSFIWWDMTWTGATCSLHRKRAGKTGSDQAEKPTCQHQVRREVLKQQLSYPAVGMGSSRP